MNSFKDGRRTAAVQNAFRWVRFEHGYSSGLYPIIIGYENIIGIKSIR